MNLSGRLSSATSRVLQPLRARLPKRSSRGTAELGVVFVSASLVLGVLFGNGLSRTSLDVTDGLSWLKDEPSGEVIQVNPATGRPTARLDVGSPGDLLDVAQYDGRLIVTNQSTGELISFDLATLLASGQRSVAKGDATSVLHHDGEVFLVDRSQGTIAAIDPVTADVIGELWTSDGGLVDAQVDGKGTVWAVDDTGLVTGLVWQHDGLGFEQVESRQVKASGPGSRLVAHDRGVTLFGPDKGIVVQVGTGTDVVANAPRLAGEIARPEQSPRNLVPVSSPQTSTVVIVGERDVREVDVATIGCRTPGRPEVYRDVVYVPCLGAGKVIRIDAQGRSAGPDIVLPDGGEPELVIDDGMLLINVQGAERGVQVMPDGSTRSFLRRDPSVPVHKVQPDSTPRLDVPDIDTIANQDRDHGRRNSPQPKLPQRPDPGRSGTHTPDLPDNHGPGQPKSPHPGANSNGPGNNGPGEGNPDDGGSSGGTDPGGEESTDPPITDPADDESSQDTETEPPAPDPITAPTAVTATLLSNGSAQVSWQHSGTAATSFRISRVGAGDVATVAGSARQAVVSVPAGTSSSFVVTAVRGGQTRASAASNSVTPSDRPGSATGVSASGNVAVSGQTETATYNASWGAAPDNGAAITGYTVRFTTNDGTRTVNVGASARSASTSWSCPYVHNPSCSLSGGNFTVTVTAENGHGAGPGASASGNAGSPAAPVPAPAPALPRPNLQIATAANTGFLGIEGIGQTTLTLAPPADWSGFQGTCRYSHHGNRLGGGQTSSYSCSATSLVVNINHGIIRSDDPIRGGTTTIDHSITFTADNGQSQVSSQTFHWTERQQTLCGKCQIP